MQTLLLAAALFAADASTADLALEVALVAADTLDRPQTATRMVNLEGDDYPIEVRLFETIRFPVNFSTYVPEDWETHVVSTPGGMASQIQADVQAGIDIFFPYDQSDVMGTWAANRDAVDGTVRVMEDGPDGMLPEWAEAGYVWYSGGMMGTSYVVEHDGTVFFLGDRMPVESGDGMAPRVHLVLDEWRWLEDGSSL